MDLANNKLILCNRFIENYLFGKKLLDKIHGRFLFVFYKSATHLLLFTCCYYLVRYYILDIDE